ncbi:MAG: nitroreductase family protein [Alphaproteobacteria bacterium]|nr:nitroreductase family protein [Alphaproteobacteria bacterium]
MINTILKRRSIRKYKPDPISGGDLRTIISAGLSAPSGCNARPWEIIVIRDDESKQKIRSFYPFARFCTESPVSILVCFNQQKTARIPGVSFNGDELAKMDAAACIQNMLLSATELNLGSCWCHAHEHMTQYRELLDLPEHIIPVGLVVLGYTDEEFELRDGYNAEVIHNEKWGQK